MRLSKFILVIFCAFILFGCRKDSLTFENTDGSNGWLRDSSLWFESNIILNSYQTGDSMLFLNADRITYLDYNQSEPGVPGSLTSKMLPFPIPLEDRYAMNAQLVTVNQGTTIAIIPVNMVKIWNEHLLINGTDIDPDFLRFASPNQGNINMALHDHDIFIPFMTRLESGFQRVGGIAHIKLNPSTDSELFTLASIETIVLPDLEENALWSAVEKVDDTFLFSFYSDTSPKTYTIDLSGSIIATNDTGYVKFLQDYQSGNLLGILNNSSDPFHLSADKGNTWRSSTSVLPNTANGIVQANIDGRTFGFHNSQIWKIGIETSDQGGSFIAEELPNEGLEGHKITTITAYRDSLVLIGTTSGAFYKNKEVFLNDN